MHQGSIEVLASLFNKSYYRGNPKWDGYVFAGYSLISADVDINATNASGAAYNFSSINASGTRKEIRDAIKNLLDDSYENNAIANGGSRRNIGRNDGNQLIRHGLSAGFGISRKLNDRISIGVRKSGGVNKGKGFNVTWYQDIPTSEGSGAAGGKFVSIDEAISLLEKEREPTQLEKGIGGFQIGFIPRYR